MIKNCIACMHELDYAYELQEQGFYIATIDKWPGSYPNHKGHFLLIVVDSKGRVVVG